MHNNDTKETPQQRAVNILYDLYPGREYRKFREKYIPRLQNAKTENEITRILRNARLES